jgi:hypothetical protein
MQIEISTDNTVEGNEALAAHVKDVIEHALVHFSDRISRVEAHLGKASDGEFGQQGKRCLLEARIEGRQPTAVSHDAVTLHDAAAGAATKLKHAVETILGKLQDARRAAESDNLKG